MVILHGGNKKKIIKKIIYLFIIFNFFFFFFSMTVSMADTKDLFVERFFGNGSYEHGGKSIQPKIIKEIINVKNKDSIVENVVEV